MKTLIYALLLALVFTALPALAAGDGFVSLAPIPNLETGEGATLARYINSVFLLVISLAAMLAVLRIVMGGFQYMTQEAITEKKEARNTIQGAVFGLILLLSVVFILNEINPQITSLEGLRFTSLGSGTEVLSEIEENREQAEKNQAAIDAAIAYFNGPPGNITRNTFFDSLVWEFNVTELGYATRRAILREGEKILREKWEPVKPKCWVEKITTSEEGVYVRCEVRDPL